MEELTRFDHYVIAALPVADILLHRQALVWQTRDNPNPLGNYDVQCLVPETIEIARHLMEAVRRQGVMEAATQLP